MTMSWAPKLPKTGEPLYLSIVKALAEDISAGKLTSGSRLPTHRELAEQLTVAIGTVNNVVSSTEKDDGEPSLENPEQAKRPCRFWPDQIHRQLTSAATIQFTARTRRCQVLSDDWRDDLKLNCFCGI